MARRLLSAKQPKPLAVNKKGKDIFFLQRCFLIEDEQKAMDRSGVEKRGEIY